MKACARRGCRRNECAACEQVDDDPRRVDERYASVAYPMFGASPIAIWNDRLTSIRDVASHVSNAPNVVERLRAMRGPGESYSDVILRLAAAEG
jgi:hypothetical protein